MVWRAPGFDDLSGGDDVEDAAAVSGVEGEAGVVEAGDDEGGAGVFAGDVICGVGVVGVVLEAEGSGVVVCFFGAGGTLGDDGCELTEFFNVDASGGRAIDDPVFVAEVFEGAGVIDGLLHGDLEESFFAGGVRGDEGEVSVAEKFVGDFLDVAFLHVSE